MRKLATSLLATAVLFTACSDDNDDPAPDSGIKTSGYVLYTQAETNYWKYYETMPEGTIDNTQGKSYANFRTRMKGENFIISSNITSSKDAGMDKMVVNADGQLEKVGQLPVIAPSYYGAIKDKNTAFIDDVNDNDITIFDPETMTPTGKIDMSKAYREDDWTNQIYESFVIRGNDMFVATRPYTQKNTLWAGSELIYNHIDLRTNAFVKSIKFPDAVVVRRTEQNYVDEHGNIYIPTQGNSNIPNIKPNIVKIPAGQTDFDLNYDFKVVDAISPAHAKMPIQVMGKFTYHKNGKAYANISTSFPQEILAIFKEKPDFSQWTPEDFQKAFALLRSSSIGQYVELDLEAQTVKILPDMPGSSPYDSYLTIIDDKVYCGVLNPSENVNALYEYDPATGTTKKAFDISQGGRISGFFKLGE
ncbi:hypothetical protein FUAX_18290 [Fulvitalea axinellae]|uniref:DUF4374 domain-containing protein n=1 Tax=Fulvitalea axinellae TaxID=1182444 RepID=A0AAU9CVC3_9BACT|nr:hypothetical protein FUAX_18290 [Fulvitalea axinellae]